MIVLAEKLVNNADLTDGCECCWPRSFFFRQSHQRIHILCYLPKKHAKFWIGKALEGWPPIFGPSPYNVCVRTRGMYWRTRTTAQNMLCAQHMLYNLPHFGIDELRFVEFLSWMFFHHVHIIIIYLFNALCFRGEHGFPTARNPMVRRFWKIEMFCVEIVPVYGIDNPEAVLHHNGFLRSESNRIESNRSNQINRSIENSDSFIRVSFRDWLENGGINQSDTKNYHHLLITLTSQKSIPNITAPPITRKFSTDSLFLLIPTCFYQGVLFEITTQTVSLLTGGFMDGSLFRHVVKRKNAKTN